MKNVKDTYDSIMNDKVNALKDLPFQVKFMSMQILAWMWAAVFGIYIIESIYAFGISALAHALFITMTVLTALYFRQIQKQCRPLHHPPHP